MKYLFIVFLFLVNCVVAQSLKIDTSYVNRQVALDRNPQISSDGRFVAYSIINEPKNGKTLTIKEVNGLWKKKFVNARNLVFLKAKPLALFINKNDSLFRLSLKTKLEIQIPNVTSYEVIEGGKNVFLIYKTKSPENNLVIQEIDGAFKKVFTKINYYKLDKARKKILIERFNKDETTLELYVIGEKNATKIYENGPVENTTFSESGNSVAFTTNQQKGQIFIYETAGALRSVSLKDPSNSKIKSLNIQGITQFLNGDMQLLVNIKAGFDSAIKPPVYNFFKYDDPIIIYENSNESILTTMQAVVDISSGNVIWEQKLGEQVRFFKGKNDNYLFIDYSKGDNDEKYWNDKVESNHYIFNCKKNTRSVNRITDLLDLSPDGENLIGYNEDGQFLLLNLETNNYYNLTDKFKNIGVKYDKGLFSQDDTLNLYFAGWSNNGLKLLFYDHYDIWELQLKPKLSLKCLTDGFGKRNNTVLRFADYSNKRNMFSTRNIILNGFNENNKKNGFFTLDSLDLALKQLRFDDAYYSYPGNGLSIMQFMPIKASNSNTWIIRRETSSDPPNYYVTSDFKKIDQITELRSDSILTTQLLNFYSITGKLLKGILYKPKDFDPQKSYPVIIHYYEAISDRLNVYLSPGLSGDRINIPWFVNRGYLVFTPDIEYTVGNPGVSALNSVVGAKHFLSKLGFVDSNRIALQGHSFAGYETNYVLTHSNEFAAAVVSAGVSNLISLYNSTGVVGFTTPTMSFYVERGQYRMGKQLWESRENYLNNSPVLNADKVTTPVFILQNKLDGAVPFTQGLEFFLALRRQKKKAWLLEFLEERHNILNVNNKLLYTQRMEQFFDYYLKGAPAPLWMVQ